jgi:hypothetical protein
VYQREKNENSKIDNESQACGPTHLMKERKRIAAKHVLDF